MSDDTENTDKLDSASIGGKDDASTSSQDISPDRMSELKSYCDALTPAEKDYVNECTSADEASEGKDETYDMEEMGEQ